MKHLIVAMVSLSFLGCFDFESAFQQYCDSGGCGDGSSTGGGGGSAGGGGGSAGGGGGSTGDGGGNAGGGIGVVGGGSGGGSAEDGGKPDSGTPDSGVTQVESCDASLCLASKYLAPTYATWSVTAASPNDVWATGALATWSHWDGVSWTSGQLPSYLAQWRLSAVGVSPSYVFLAGDDGVFRRARDGGTWALVRPAGDDTTYGLWADSDVEQFAVGSTHWIAKGDGSHWTDELRITSAPSGTLGLLTDVDGKPGHVYAVGGYDNGAAVVWHRMDAGVWEQEPIPVTTSLEKVSVANPTSVWAVGNSGVVLERQADAGWRLHDFPTSIDFEAAWASSASDAWVGGWSGALWHWNGQSWSEVSPPGLTADFDIFDISGVGTTDLFLAATYDTHIGSYGDQFDGGHVFHYRRR